MKKKPDFFVIGVVKGGSTSLYHYLDQHPEVYLPPIKETNHFAKADIHPEDFLPEYALDVKLDLDAYIKKGMPEKIHIAHVNSDEHYFALYDKVEGEKTLGDVSNSYMANSKPPPKAKPFTAAITGLPKLSIRSKRIFCP